MTVRLSSTVSDETAEKILYWSKKLNINKSQMINISILAGLDTVIRAISPMESMTPEQIVQIGEALVEKGYTLPGFPPGGKNEA